MEFSLGDLTTSETGGCSEGAGSPADLALTLRARNLPAAGEEFDTCLGVFLLVFF